MKFRFLNTEGFPGRGFDGWSGDLPPGKADSPQLGLRSLRDERGQILVSQLRWGQGGRALGRVAVLLLGWDGGSLGRGKVLLVSERSLASSPGRENQTLPRAGGDEAGSLLAVTVRSNINILQASFGGHFISKDLKSC